MANEENEGLPGRARFQPRAYAAVLDSVISADDLIVMVDLGVHELYKRMRVRLAGVDAPNAIGEPDDSDAGQLRSLVRRLIGRNRLRVTVEQERAQSWICVVEVKRPSGGYLNLNAHLMQMGHVFVKE